MTDPNSSAPAAELYVRMETACEGTPYRISRTDAGFDLTVDVRLPQWQTLLIRLRKSQVHTYRIALTPAEKTFTLTDVVRTVERVEGPGGVGLRLGKTVSVGRTLSTTSHRTLDGTDEYTFSSAEGHRLIRGVTGELGWQETRPAALKIAATVGICACAAALATLITVAVVNWL
ncbi:hypothetical protein ACIQNU_41430 [Streptomyces sp. NPDC091292]|uniref:hypothetical protein n=1 Tax=Streptomyces sp. NPDC091292 TaxID=3365991 RepID=UPI00381751CA